MENPVADTAHPNNEDRLTTLHRPYCPCVFVYVKARFKAAFPYSVLHDSLQKWFWRLAEDWHKDHPSIPWATVRNYANDLTCIRQEKLSKMIELLIQYERCLYRESKGGRRKFQLKIKALEKFNFKNYRNKYRRQTGNPKKIWKCGMKNIKCSYNNKNDSKIKHKTDSKSSRQDYHDFLLGNYHKS